MGIRFLRSHAHPAAAAYVGQTERTVSVSSSTTSCALLCSAQLSVRSLYFFDKSRHVYYTRAYPTPRIPSMSRKDYVTPDVTEYAEVACTRIFYHTGEPTLTRRVTPRTPSNPRTAVYVAAFSRCTPPIYRLILHRWPAVPARRQVQRRQRRRRNGDRLERRSAGKRESDDETWSGTDFKDKTRCSRAGACVCSCEADASSAYTRAAVHGGVP